MPSRTCSSARAAACRFNSSMVTRDNALQTAAGRKRAGLRRAAYLASFSSEEQALYARLTAADRPHYN